MEEQKLVFFEEIGLLYRKKREEKGLSIEDIMQELKFSAEIVCAMENADINALPRAVYTKGFYRSYGQLLDIDQDVIDAFIKTVFVEDVQYLPKTKSLGTMHADQKDITVSFDSEIEQGVRRSVIKRRVILIVILCCIIASISYCVWNPSVSDVSSGDAPSDTRSTMPEDVTTEAIQGTAITNTGIHGRDAVQGTTASQPTAGDAVGATVAKASEEVSSNPYIDSTKRVPVKNATEVRALQQDVTDALKDQKNTQNYGQDVPLLPTQVRSESTVPSVKNVTFADSITKELQSLEKNTAPSSTVASNNIVVQENANTVKTSESQGGATERLRIVATERVWIAAEYNGRKRDFFLEPNQEKILKFQGVLSLKIGNLAAVTLQYKGKTMSALGEAGEVGTYTFNAE